MTDVAAAARRLIICSDAANEADDQFAIVHALLSDTLDVRTVVASHFGSPGSLEASLEEIERLRTLIGRDVPVRAGAPAALADERTASPSEGSRAIVHEARSAPGRLYIAVLGPLTDVASALLEAEDLAQRDVVVVWIGGPPYDGVAAYRPEFNLINDVAAANVVMSSGLEVWQVPMSVYTMVGVGHAELRTRLRGSSPLGDYLVEQLIAFNATVPYGPLDFRSLGDSPAVGAVLNPAGARWTLRGAPRFDSEGDVEAIDSGASIHVCDGIDTRWLVEDMFAKLREFGETAGTERSELPQ